MELNYKSTSQKCYTCIFPTHFNACLIPPGVPSVWYKDKGYKGSESGQCQWYNCGRLQEWNQPTEETAVLW